MSFTHHIKAVDPQRFSFALGVYAAAAGLKGPSPNPQQFGLNLVEDDGSISRITFTDRAENRGLLAVKKEFPDPQEFRSMAFRLMSFGGIMKDQKLRRMGLIRDGEPGSTKMHDAVINAFAMAPFRKSGKLDRMAFLALVKSEHKRIEAMESGAAPATT
jgi:hypothetical protein